jgi:hypothetical protein
MKDLLRADVADSVRSLAVEMLSWTSNSARF